jgi:hypothetical protein
MLHYYMHDGPAAFRFELAGDMATGDAAKLEQEWRTASSTIGDRTLIIDLSFVRTIDEAARSLFRRWLAAGAQFAAISPQSRTLVETITGRPFLDHQPQAPTYAPWLSGGLSRTLSRGLTSLSAILPMISLMGFLASAPAIQAAELKPETLNAWDQYVQSADTAMQTRLRPGHSFLWVDEASDRRRQLRSGEILAISASGHNPKQVPSGLIHHWLGAAFIPNARLSNVLGVVRDYTHYKDYYNPSVIDSRTIRQAQEADRFSTLLMNKAMFLKIALENECESSYVPAGPGRWYSTATTVRVQEIEDYGQAGEHKLPSGKGSGYIWRLHGITRYEEGDGGVYMEIEAIALSREIPAAMRWAVDPIVRRVSKGSLVTSLRQTQDAVGSSAQIAAGQTPRMAKAVPAMGSGFTRAAEQH